MSRESNVAGYPASSQWSWIGNPTNILLRSACLSIMLVMVVPPVLCVFTNTTGDGEHCSYEPSWIDDKNFGVKTGSTLSSGESRSGAQSSSPSQDVDRFVRMMLSMILLSPLLKCSCKLRPTTKRRAMIDALVAKKLWKAWFWAFSLTRNFFVLLRVREPSSETAILDA